MLESATGVSASTPRDGCTASRAATGRAQKKGDDVGVLAAKRSPRFQRHLVGGIGDLLGGKSCPEPIGILPGEEMIVRARQSRESPDLGESRVCGKLGDGAPRTPCSCVCLLRWAVQRSLLHYDPYPLVYRWSFVATYCVDICTLNGLEVL